MPFGDSKLSRARFWFLIAFLCVGVVFGLAAADNATKGRREATQRYAETKLIADEIRESQKLILKGQADDLAWRSEMRAMLRRIDSVLDRVEPILGVPRP